ncbi:MAG: DUF4405 domain-containing protein [Rhodobacteraceae bacterium]|nr:DUF4405 domain-containing protein [Paracoccaceae bacterium]
MSTLRKIATPLTIGTSLLMSVTGVLMFFHTDTGLNKLAHEWIGLLFVGAIGLHVLVNQRPFIAHLKRPLGQAAALAFGGALMLSFLPLGGQAKGGGRPDFALLQRIETAPIAAVATVLNENPEDLAARLRLAGYPATDLDSTIAGLSGGGKKEGMALISVLLAQ